MLTFLSMVFLIYGAMHFYALGKVWLAFPHTLALTSVLLFCGIVMTFSPLIVWQFERQNWHNVTVISSWVSYIWMGFLFLFCSIALIFDLGHTLSTLLGFEWPMNASTVLVTVGLLALAILGYGFVEARQMHVEKIKISTPKLSPAVGRVTIAQISDLHLGVMLGDEFLDRVIARLREIRPDSVHADAVAAHVHRQVRGEVRNGGLHRAIDRLTRIAPQSFDRMHVDDRTVVMLDHRSDERAGSAPDPCGPSRSGRRRDDQ